MFALCCRVSWGGGQEVRTRDRTSQGDDQVVEEQWLEVAGPPTGKYWWLGPPTLEMEVAYSHLS